MQNDRLSRQILVHGLAMVLAGLAWGFFVPATPYPRLGLGAHIQLTSSGLLFVIVAILLLTLRHRVGQRGAQTILLSAWLTWPMLFSEIANAWWGTARMLPIAASQAGVQGGEMWQELVVQLTHIVAGLALLAAWSLLLIGFVRRPPSIDDA